MSIHGKFMTCLGLVSGLLACATDHDSLPRRNGHDRSNLAPGETSVCTEIGCVDTYTLTIATPDDALPRGTYEFALVVDGRAARCSVVWSAPVFGEASTPCGDGIMLTVGNLSSIQEIHNSDGSVSASVVRHPSRFATTVTLLGAPQHIEATFERDDAEIARARFMPSYTESRPNGPDCAPVCQMGADRWVVSIP